MTFKERAVAALEEHLKGTKGVVKATILDCLTIVKQVPDKDNKIVTNADRIRAMSDQELALFLTQKYAQEMIWRLRDQGYNPTATQIKYLNETLHMTWTRWLRQQAEGVGKIKQIGGYGK